VSALSPPDSPSDPVLGDRYRLVERIASGGMGTVWRAEDTVLRRPVAVKVLNEGLSSDERFVERFRREAKAAGGLLHPNVAGVYDYGEEGGRPFIVMELIDGETLAEALVRRGRLDPDEVADVGAQVADALAAAHAAGIVHRDVKPANVMLTAGGHVQVMDFGIAAAESGTGLTGTGMVMGTARYIAPEQALGNPATPASDLYSLGVVLYELLTGAPPFDRGTPLATAMAHVKEDPVPLATARPDTPPRLAALVEGCLAKDPGDRPGSAAELAAALREERAPEPGAGAAAAVAVLPEDATMILPAAEATEALPAPDAEATEAPSRAPVARPSPPTARPRRRRRWVVAAAVVVLAALVVVLAVALAGPRHVQLASFVGKTRGEAASTAHRLEVALRFVPRASDAPEGTVFRQVPPPGTSVPQGSTVILLLSTGPGGPSGTPPPPSPGEGKPPKDHGHGKGKGHGEGGGGD
jgi:eukaryotic-like serine/threonine-protein kinase